MIIITTNIFIITVTAELFSLSLHIFLNHYWYSNLIFLFNVFLLPLFSRGTIMEARTFRGFFDYIRHLRPNSIILQCIYYILRLHISITSLIPILLLTANDEDINLPAHKKMVFEVGQSCLQLLRDMSHNANVSQSLIHLHSQELNGFTTSGYFGQNISQTLELIAAFELIPFTPSSYFYNPWKRQKTFSGCIEIGHWHEKGQCNLYRNLLTQNKTYVHWKHKKCELQILALAYYELLC